MSEPSKSMTETRTETRTNSPSQNVVISDRAVSIVALTLSLVLMLFCYALWARYDLLRMFYEDIKTELIRTGHDVHPHLPMEKP